MPHTLDIHVFCDIPTQVRALNERAPMSARHRMAANTRWANEPDRKAATAKAREAWNTRFHREAREKFPDADDATIDRLATNAKKAFYDRLTMKAAEARRRYARERRQGKAA